MGGAHFTVLLGVQSSIMETTADDFWRFFIKCLANGTLTSSPRLLVKSYKRTKLYECVCVYNYCKKFVQRMHMEVFNTSRLVHLGPEYKPLSHHKTQIFHTHTYFRTIRNV